MTKRIQNLSLDLEYAFQIPKMVKVWKDTVRTGLRRQPLEDIHDFLDIHRNIDAFAGRLRKDVLDGHYKPSAPEFVHLEKRDGIPRRLAIPNPADALLLQCIVEVLESELKKAQPTQKAYYSRSHMPGSVEQVDGTFGYPWWIMWPQFQQRVWKFTSSYKYLVVADIANYFDCIPLASLRNTLASFGQFSENLLNFLFYLLETFSWRPYYMPHSGVGLPQINFDAPRLLANAYLFKIDEELERVTSGDFVRWMDDIDAGVASRESGKKLLRDLDAVLCSQGIRLNTNKSKILTGKEAIDHFWIQENRALTIIENSMKNGSGGESTQTLQKTILKNRFRKFERKKRVGSWDKVYKRYLNLFGRIGDICVERHLPTILAEVPSLRGAAFHYLAQLGPSMRRLSIIEDFVMSGHCEDDVSLFEAVRCLIAWETPATGKLVSKLVILAQNIAKKHGSYSFSGVTASVWLLAKYGTQAELMTLIASSRNIWEKSPWAARQIAAITPLLLEQDRYSIFETVTQNGLLQALQVLAHISSIKRLTRLDNQLDSYLKHKPSSGLPYPLPKVIMVIALLQGSLDPQQKTALHTHLLTILPDRRYKHLILNYT